MNNILSLLALIIFFSSVFFERWALYAYDLDQHEISGLVQELNAIKPQDFGLPKNRCDLDGAGDEKNIPALVREKPFEMKCPLSAETLCQQVAEECTKQHSRLYCFDYMLSKGTSNMERSKKILQQSAELFYQMTRDDSNGSLQKICCDRNLNDKQKTNCENEFEQTQLVLVDDTSSLIGVFSRVGVRNYVKVSRAILENCLNLECIEQIFMHELGHSCDSSRRVALKLNSNPYGLTCNNRKDKAAPYDLIPQKSAECIDQKLHLASNKAKSEDQSLCFSAWKAEAFANAIFIEKYDSFAHFAWNCFGVQDSLHAETKTYLSCLIEQPNVHDHFCPKK